MFLTSNFEITCLLPILIMMGIGLIIPMCLNALKIKFIPVSIVEIFFGIILGMIFRETKIFEGNIIEGTYNIGLILLLFLSGYETDYTVLKKNLKGDGVNINPFKYACIILGLVFVLSLGLSFVFSKYIIGDYLSGIFLIFVALSSTFASIVVPIVHEAGAAKTTCGKIFVTYATLSELLSILMLSVFMLIHGITEGGNPLYLLILLAVLLLVYFFSKKVQTSLYKKSSSNFVHVGLRFCLFVVLGLSILSYMSGVEIIFGAFLAGMILKKIDFSIETEHKVGAIGYGLFIPLFYMIAGYKINVLEIFSEPSNILLVGLLILAFILVKLPFMVLKKYYKAGTCGPSMLLSCCSLIVPLSIEHLSHGHILNPEFVECIIFASAILIIIAPIVFRLNKKFNVCKEEYRDVILEPGEEEPGESVA